MWRKLELKLVPRLKIRCLVNIECSAVQLFPVQMNCSLFVFGYLHSACRCRRYVIIICDILFVGSSIQL